MQIELEKITALVREAAQQEIMTRYQKASVSRKRDGSLVTDADVAVQAKLQQSLETLHPGFAFLAEEMSVEEQYKQFESKQQSLWILDPLDGTSNYASSIPYFAISLALVQGGDVVLGVVYDPTRDELFTAQKGKGAFLNGQKIQAVVPEQLKSSIGMIDFKRLGKSLAQHLAGEPPYASQRSFGSVALDWCWLAAGRGHIYLHGRQNIWDYIAGMLVLHEAGGASSTLDEEVVYSGSMDCRSAIAATTKPLFDQWQSLLMSLK